MIKTKYNFKLWLHRKYPQITATPIYGVPAYLLSKPLDAQDNFIYNVQQLPDGHYVVFIGMTPEEAREHLRQIKKEGVPKVNYRAIRTEAPTTFASFQNWLERNKISPINRTFCSRDSIANLFKNPELSLEKRAWYMYEIPTTLSDEGEPQVAGQLVSKVFQNIPHIASVSTTLEGLRVPVTIVLIKASTSIYKSKRQRFAEKFDLMQPLYEKLIAVCAKAEVMEQQGLVSTEWEEAKGICEHYMGILFETEGTVDLNKLKEASHEGCLGFFTRERTNLVSNEGTAETF